jgi:TPR repeat protein
MPRLLPVMFAALGLLCGSISVLAGDVGADSIRLAQQRWSPLTGPVPDDGVRKPAEEPEPEPAPPPKAAPAPEPAPAPAASTAVPTELRKLTLKATLASATTDGRAHGALGVRTFTVDRDLAQGLGLGGSGGVLVTDVTRGGAGDAAQLRAGDILQRLGTRAIASNDDFLTRLRDTSTGAQVDIEVMRAGEGTEDLRRFLVSQSDGGNTGATAGLARLLFLGVLFARDEREAARLFLKAAETGHVPSMTNYALLAKDGVGVAKSDTEAAKWFLKAAEAGNDAAMTNLAGLYETGRGATKDVTEAARWYRRASDAGNAIATHRLALMYEAGRGVAKDDSEAVRLLRSASDKGLSDATAKLADNYAQGRGVPKDADESRRMSERAAGQVRSAADAGNTVAMFNLGIIYRTGKGVTQSDAEGARWVAAAFKKGDKYLVNELMRNPDTLSLADRKWLQTVLRDEGTYKGAIDGAFGAPLRAAMEALAGKQ